MLLKINFKIRIVFVAVATIIFSTCFFGYAELEEIAEKTTAKGKVISGLNKKEALEKFGLPYQASEKFWYYDKPERFWVYFKKPPELLSIAIFPKLTTTTVGNPVMFKAIGEYSDFRIKDITGDVEWISEDKEIADFVEDGVVLSFSEGTTQVLVLKDSIISAIAELNIIAKEVEKSESTVELTALDVIPQNPQISFRQDKVIFKALGTFKDYENSEFFVRDVSSDENLTWRSKDEDVATFVDNIAYLGLREPAQTEISCNKGLIVSPTQTLTLLDIPLVIPERKLESIIVLPQTLVTHRNKTAEFRAFATFNDSSFKEVTLDAEWIIKNYEIASLADKGIVTTKKSGVTEIEVSMDGVLSQPRKLVVLRDLPIAKAEKKEKTQEETVLNQLNQSLEKLEQSATQQETQELLDQFSRQVEKLKTQGRLDQATALHLKTQAEEIVKAKFIAAAAEEEELTQDFAEELELEVEEQVDQLKEKMTSSLQRELKSIQIIPINPDIALGNELPFRAKGEYSDSSIRDLTSKVKWQSSDSNIATITQDGVVQSKSVGKARISASLGKINSEPQNLSVTAPSLVSITVTPANPTVNIGEIVQVKALGEYSDGSQKDITSKVSWISDDEEIVSEGKLNVHRVGEARIFAKLGNIESDHQRVTVAPLSLIKLLWMNIFRLFNLFLFLSIAFLILVDIMYLRHYLNIKHLKKLVHTNPRSFITRLYYSLISVFGLYGLPRKKSMPLGEYVKQVRQKYRGSNLDHLVSFTERFNEARYSSHLVSSEAADNSAREYDIIISSIRKFNRLRTNFIAHFKLIFKRLPLKISH